MKNTPILSQINVLSQINELEWRLHKHFYGMETLVSFGGSVEAVNDIHDQIADLEKQLIKSQPKKRKG